MLSEEAKAIAAEAGVELVDYFAREELAIRNAIRQAIGAVEADVAATLAANMDHMVIPKEYQHAE